MSARVLVARPRGISASGIAGIATGLALLIGIYQLARPHVLGGELGYNLGYDDGVYVGAAVRLVHGAMPYGDFTFVHPPGIVLWLSPLALIGRAAGTHAALELARCLNVAVVAANAGLAAYVVRSRGRVAAAVAGFGVALWPASIGVSRTVELEPWLVMFCLLGAIAFTEGRKIASGRRMLWSGIWFGLALSTKVWAILPIAACVVVLVVIRSRQRLIQYFAGLGAAVAIVCGPFFLAAPGRFVHDVIDAQATRKLGGLSTGPADWVRELTGVAALPGARQSTALAAVILAVLAVLVARAFWLHRSRRAPVDWFVLLLAVVTSIGMRQSGILLDHYAYFPAVMLLLLAAVSVGGGEVRLPSAIRSYRFASVSAVALALVVVLVVEHVRWADQYLAESSDPSQELALVIPKGACTLSDFPTDLLLANRYTGSGSCPDVVDPYGLFLAEDGGTYPHLEPPPFHAHFVADWQRWLSRAEYVDLRIPFSDFVPFSQPLITWFNQHYKLVAHFSTRYEHTLIDPTKDEYLYLNVTPGAGGS